MLQKIHQSHQGAITAELVRSTQFEFGPNLYVGLVLHQFGIFSQLRTIFANFPLPVDLFKVLLTFD